MLNVIFYQDELKLGELGVQCMCDLLTSHPNFNYSQNIAQAVVPFLNHHNKTVREMVKEACKTVFKEDKKQEITLKVCHKCYYLLVYQNKHMIILDITNN